MATLEDGCCVQEVVDDNGGSGATGPTGATGPAGQAAFTTTTADYVQPAIAATVIVDVLNSDWIGVGEAAFVTTGGYYVVTAKPDSTHVTLQNTGAAGNASPGANIAFPAELSCAGVQGAAGPVGPTGGTGPAGPATRSVVADWAALIALDCTTFVAGHECFVVSLLDTCTLSATALASDTTPGPLRIATATNAPVGLKWSRRGDTNEIWKRVTTFFFNNTTGSDEAAGSSSITPLKTAEEFYRRTGGQVTNNTTFTIQDGNYSFDMPIHAVAPGNSRARITVIGTPATAGSGTVSSTTARTGNVSAQLTSTALSMAGFEGNIIRMTSGAITGSICPIVSDLGANTAEIEPGFCTDPAGGSSGLPANGTTFDVLAPAQTLSMATSLGVEATFKYFLLSDRIQTPLFVTVGCKISQMSAGSYASASYVGRLVGSSITSTVTIQAGAVSIEYCAVLDQVNVTGGSSVSVSKTVGRKATPTNGIFNVGNNDGSLTGVAGIASIVMSDVGLQGATNAAGLYVGAGGFAAISASPFYGSGGQYGVTIANGGRVQVAVGITNPTITGTASDILIDGVTSHIPPLIGGLVTPAAQPMTTWAAWAAAPFSTQVVKYGSGSSLIKGV